MGSTPRSATASAASVAPLRQEPIQFIRRTLHREDLLRARFALEFLEAQIAKGDVDQTSLAKPMDR